MEKSQATAFPYLRFILLNGESLYAGVFFITFFRTVRSCSASFSYRICSCVHIRAVNTSRRARNEIFKSELDIIYQYAAPTKAETFAGMKEIVHVIKDILTKAIVENAIRKLEKIPEPECSQFVAATKSRFLAERDNSIRQRLAASKAQEPILQGHDLTGIERFHPETRKIPLWKRAQLYTT